mmetsp:Transcript_95374/g.294194  ORF Transcript_95374/g.294194 Transcript_95374/m.294194 type:complete len:380 (+) Transcript_95374:437-1576(+)
MSVLPTVWGRSAKSKSRPGTKGASCSPPNAPPKPASKASSPPASGKSPKSPFWSMPGTTLSSGRRKSSCGSTSRCGGRPFASKSSSAPSSANSVSRAPRPSSSASSGRPELAEAREPASQGNASGFSTTTVEKRSEKLWGPSPSGWLFRTSFSMRCGRRPRHAKSHLDHVCQLGIVMRSIMYGGTSLCSCQWAARSLSWCLCTGSVSMGLIGLSKLARSKSGLLEGFFSTSCTCASGATTRAPSASANALTDCLFSFSDGSLDQHSSKYANWFGPPPPQNFSKSSSKAMTSSAVLDPTSARACGASTHAASTSVSGSGGRSSAAAPATGPSGSSGGAPAASKGGASSSNSGAASKPCGSSSPSMIGGIGGAWPMAAGGG